MSCFAKPALAPDQSDELTQKISGTVQIQGHGEDAGACQLHLGKVTPPDEWLIYSLT